MLVVWSVHACSNDMLAGWMHCCWRSGGCGSRVAGLRLGAYNHGFIAYVDMYCLDSKKQWWSFCWSWAPSPALWYWWHRLRVMAHSCPGAIAQWLLGSWGVRSDCTRVVASCRQLLHATVLVLGHNERSAAGALVVHMLRAIDYHQLSSHATCLHRPLLACLLALGSTCWV
jgi:hypothetical protein